MYVIKDLYEDTYIKNLKDNVADIKDAKVFNTFEKADAFRSRYLSYDYSIIKIEKELENDK